jgi:hypothetical protein
MAEVSAPIWQWTKTPVMNSALPKAAMVSNVNYPTFNATTPAQSTPRYGSTGSGGSGGSPSLGQVLANLQSALQQLSVALSNYKH